MIHRNAKLTVAGRLLIVRRIQDGWTQAEVAEALGVSRSTSGPTIIPDAGGVAITVTPEKPPEPTSRGAFGWLPFPDGLSEEEHEHHGRDSGEPQGNHGPCRNPLAPNVHGGEPRRGRGTVLGKNWRRDQLANEHDARGDDDQVIEIPEHGNEVRDQVDGAERVSHDRSAGSPRVPGDARIAACEVENKRLLARERNSRFQSLAHAHPAILQQPIVLLAGKVLDGRNRLAACEAAGVEARFVEYDAECDPLDWVLAQNRDRRHLTINQLHAITAEYVPKYRSGNANGSNNTPEPHPAGQPKHFLRACRKCPQRNPAKRLCSLRKLRG